MENNIFKVKLRTLTPIWTGGVNGYCDRLHETGIIGSLRWWYEIIVKGLDEYVCDPTVTESCEKKDNNKGGKGKICPVCYLFGCGGWKRQFRLHIKNAPTAPLHFRTSVNKNWLKEIFGGESKEIDNLNVFYGDIILQFVFRKNEANSNNDYAKSQLMMLLEFVFEYGGLGAKLQHGFGQVEILEPESAKGNEIIQNGLKDLDKRTQAGEFLQKEEPSPNNPYTLKNFISLDYDLPVSSLQKFIERKMHIGSPSKASEKKYVPNAFDIKYKGLGNLGMRRWLKEKKSWSESDDPEQLGQIDELLGPRSRWKSEGSWKNISEDKRTAGRLYFGMPYRLNSEKYRLHIFGFTPQHILNPSDLITLCKEYIDYAFNKKAKIVKSKLGKEIIECLGDKE